MLARLAEGAPALIRLAARSSMGAFAALFTAALLQAGLRLSIWGQSHRGFLTELLPEAIILIRLPVP